MSSGLFTVAAVGVLAVLVRLLTGPATLNPDANMALYWGREIIHGHLPTYPLGLDTPHPLWIAYGAVCALLGSSTMSLAFYVSAGALVWGGFRLAAAISTPLGGIVAAVLIATTASVLDLAGLDMVDVPFAALVLWALVLEAEKPKRGTAVLALLVLAGLLRPDGWILSGLYWLYLVRDPTSTRARLQLTALAFAAPVLWTASDVLITGDPMFSLNSVQLFARNSYAHPVRTQLPSVIAHSLRGMIGTVVIAGGAIGTLISLQRRDRRAIPVTAVVICGLFAFAAAGFRGLELYDRFLVYVAIGLTVLCGYAIARASRFARSWQAIAGVVLSIWVVASIPGRLSALADVHRGVQASTLANAEVAALAAQPTAAKLLRTCRTDMAPTIGMVPDLMWTDDLSASHFPPTWTVPKAGSTAYVTASQRPSTSWFTWSRTQQRTWLPPVGFKERVVDGHYALYTRGC